MRRIASSPRKSRPTAVTGITFKPCLARWYEALMGAPPRNNPFGRQSHNTSPKQTTVGSPTRFCGDAARLLILHFLRPEVQFLAGPQIRGGRPRLIRLAHGPTCCAMDPFVE